MANPGAFSAEHTMLMFLSNVKHVYSSSVGKSRLLKTYNFLIELKPTLPCLLQC